MNLGSVPQFIAVGQKANSWLMTATPTDSKTVNINGKTPAIDAKGNLSGLNSVAAKGSLSLPAQSIAFVAVTDANNASCK